MTIVRQLVAEFGFQVDTTPADRFDAAVKRSKRNLTDFSKIDLVRFSRGLKRALAGTAAIFAAEITAGLLGAFKQADIKKVEEQLKFQFRADFDSIRQEVERILKDPILGRLTTELELLNAAATLRGEGFQPDVIKRNLANVLKFSTIMRENLEQGTQSFLGALKSGDLKLFIQAGKFSAQQAQLIEKTGTGLGRLGLLGRVIEVEKLFGEIDERVNKRLVELISTGALAQERLFNTLDKLAVEIGDKTLPAFRDLNKELLPFIDSLIKLVRGEIEIGEVLAPKARPGSEREQRIKETSKQAEEQIQAVINFFKRFLTREGRQEFFTRQRRARTLGIRDPVAKLPIRFGAFPDPEPTPQTVGGNVVKTVNHISFKFNIAPGASADTNELRRVFKDEAGKMFGSIKEQSRDSRLIRGSGQAP